MVPELGHSTYEEDPGAFLGRAAHGFGGRLYSEATAREIDCAVRELVDAAFQRAKAILAANRPSLDKAAGLLLERETLAEADLRGLFSDLAPPSPGGDASPLVAAG
jgi:cell division protease FtsH